MKREDLLPSKVELRMIEQQLEEAHRLAPQRAILRYRNGCHSNADAWLILSLTRRLRLLLAGETPESLRKTDFSDVRQIKAPERW